MASCKDRGTSISFFDVIDGRCSKCHFDKERANLEAPPLPALSDVAHIILSTEAAPDLRVSERLNIVTAEFAVGLGLLTDLFNAWRDVFCGRSKSYQNALKDARKEVLQELRREAHQLGDDAVPGVSLDYSEISGGGKSMMFLVASGTAVRLIQSA